MFVVISLRISLTDKSIFPPAVDIRETEPVKIFHDLKKIFSLSERPAASLLVPGDGQTVPHKVVILTSLSLLLHLLTTCPHPPGARLHTAANKKWDNLVRIWGGGIIIKKVVVMLMLDITYICCQQRDQSGDVSATPTPPWSPGRPDLHRTPHNVWD